MDRKLLNADTNALKAELVKSDKALANFLNKYDLKRDIDVDEIHLASLDLIEIRSLERFKNLQILWLQSNKIKTLSFIQGSKYLTEIYLQNNFIQTITNCFRNLANLMVIHLQANQLSDLENTADELRYLKFLKNLNLFDNPIELEKDYRKLILFKIPSLKIFDRNTISNQEKIKSIKIYQPERARINEKHAFLRSINLNDDKFLINTNKTPIKLNYYNKNYASTSLSYLPPLNYHNNDSNNKSTIKYYNDDHYQQEKMFKTSIKEFSYFDWSKVKLYDTTNSYLIDTNSKTDRLVTNNNDLPQVITIRFT